MKKGQVLTPNILALISNQPLMERVYQLMDSNLDEVNFQQQLRKQVVYYFKLGKPDDALKVDAVVSAINHITLNERSDETVIAAVEKDLDRKFNGKNSDDFKKLMTMVAGNFKEMRSLPVPSVKAPSLPPLPTGKVAAQDTIERAASLKNKFKKPSAPITFPRPAQHSEQQTTILKAIAAIDINSEFSVQVATSFLKSQKASPRAAESGYGNAAKKLGIDKVVQSLDRLADVAIKRGDENELKDTMGFITEVLGQIRDKKAVFEGRRDQSELMNHRATVARAVLTRAEQKLQATSEKCYRVLISTETVKHNAPSR